MSPHKVPLSGRADPTGVLSAALCVHKLTTLRNRSDFLRANGGLRRGTSGFLLQARERRQDEAPADTIIRVGFTCSKKVGNAVARNRAKRRLREIARLILPLEGHPGWDYVLIGRAEKTASLPFDDMKAHLSRALIRLHEKRPKK